MSARTIVAPAGRRKPGPPRQTGATQIDANRLLAPRPSGLEVAGVTVLSYSSYLYGHGHR